MVICRIMLQRCHAIFHVGCPLFSLLSGLRSSARGRPRGWQRAVCLLHITMTSTSIIQSLPRLCVSHSSSYVSALYYAGLYVGCLAIILQTGLRPFIHNRFCTLKSSLTLSSDFLLLLAWASLPRLASNRQHSVFDQRSDVFDCEEMKIMPISFEVPDMIASSKTIIQLNLK